ncbi:MAG: HAMP domain-containing protein [Myxococcales bacterium]|nr:HAMP domain-containing protein [Myxococcales bacterium]
MRPRATILVKLLLAFVLPTVVLFAAFAVVAHEVTRRDLDDELGTRLEAIAAAAATHIRGKYLAELGPGDETERAYQNVMRKLESVAITTGADLFVFDRALDSRADTKGAAIGTHYFRVELDRHELARVFGQGRLAHSVTFDGDDGRTYKAGYAPVRASETEPEIVLAIAAQAPAQYFDRLRQLRGSLLLWGGLLVAVVLAATVGATLLVTRPVRQLALAAERIGRGELGAPIDVRGHDEIGTLAQTMDRMREQLAERDAHMQRMLAGIAHEVRNPLAGMTLFTGILRDELPAGEAGEDCRGHVARIERELGYLERVVSEFLDYARRPAPERASFDLGDLAQEVAQLATTPEISVIVETKAETRAKTDAETKAETRAKTDAETRAKTDAETRTETEAPRARTSPPGDEPARTGTSLRLHGDRAQLRRALLNITQNAVQATCAGGRTEPVRLAVRRAGQRLLLTITNPGANLPAEVRARMFEPFFTTREKGTGLGLAFAKEIIADHGGQLSAEVSDDETTFVVELTAEPADI